MKYTLLGQKVISVSSQLFHAAFFCLSHARKHTTSKNTQPELSNLKNAPDLNVETPIFDPDLNREDLASLED